MVNVNTGLYNFSFNGLHSAVLHELSCLYPDSITQSVPFPDFVIDVHSTSALRRLFRPQVTIKIDGQQPFNPIPPSKLLPSIEWSMNWSIAAYDHTKLLIHCSVIEKNGKVIMFPAKSGSGKSTTSTFMALNGWHLYFDEMAVIDLKTGEIQPVYRPSSLKNKSIDIIRPYCKNAYISAVTPATHKGDIAHVRVMDRQTFNALKPLPPFAVVFLDFNPEFDFSAYQVDQSIGFSKLIANAFNYSVIGENAFNTLYNLISKVQTYEVSYSSLEEIQNFLEEIISDE